MWESDNQCELRLGELEIRRGQHELGPPAGSLAHMTMDRVGFLLRLNLTSLPAVVIIVFVFRDFWEGSAPLSHIGATISF